MRTEFYKHIWPSEPQWYSAKIAFALVGFVGVLVYKSAFLFTIALVVALLIEFFVYAPRCKSVSAQFAKKYPSEAGLLRVVVEKNT